jgi:hypothetical protein
VSRAVRGAAAVAALLAVAACGGGKEPGPPSFPTVAKPLEEIERYGDVVPIRFTIVNGNADTYVVDRAEALNGERRELAEFTTVEIRGQAGGGKAKVVVTRGLLAPGEELSFTVPEYRVITAGERVLLTVRKLDAEQAASLGAPDADGRVVLSRSIVAVTPEFAGAETVVPAPLAPYPSRVPTGAAEAWTFSPTLGGYVYRISSGDFRLVHEKTDDDLPPVPFGFLDDVEAGHGPVKVLLPNGDVKEVVPENLHEFLKEVLARRRAIAFSEKPDRAPWQVQDW